MHYNLLSLAVHGAFTSFYRCLKVTQLDNFDSNSSCARDGVGVIVVGVVNSYSFFGWDLFTTSSKCSKIQWLHSIEIQNVENVCVCVCICVAMGCYAKWNRKSIGFILIKLKSNFSLSRLHSSIFPIIRRFTIFIELNCCASGYCSVFFMQSMHVRSHHISHSNGCNRRFTQWIHKSRNAKIDFSNLFFINCSIPAELFMHLIWN